MASMIFAAMSNNGALTCTNSIMGGIK